MSFKSLALNRGQSRSAQVVEGHHQRQEARALAQLISGRPACLPSHSHHSLLSADQPGHKHLVAEGACINCGLCWLYGETRMPRFGGYLKQDVLSQLRVGSVSLDTALRWENRSWFGLKLDQGCGKDRARILLEATASLPEPILAIGFHKRLARVYDRAIHDPLHPLVSGSYAAFKAGIAYQYAELKQRLRVIPTESDPYETADAMFADIERGRLLVYTGGELPEDHPMRPMADRLQWNVIFRAVHDWCHYGGAGCEHYRFGSTAHGKGGDGLFGEEQTFARHRQAFIRTAWLALACETRAQTAANNFLEFGLQGGFVEQKAALLPAWTYER